MAQGYTAPVGIHGVLSVLEELAAASGRDSAGVVPQHFEWLELHGAVALMAGQATRLPLGDATATRFAGIDALRPGERSLRLGLAYVAGTVVAADGARRRVFEPLLTMPVTVTDMGGALHPAGDVQASSLVTRRTVRDSLERLPTMLMAAADRVASQQRASADAAGAAAPAGAGLVDIEVLGSTCLLAAQSIGIDARRVVAVEGSAGSHARNRIPTVVAGSGVFALHSAPDFSAADSLHRWQDAIGTTLTALHALYLDHPVPPPLPAPTHDIPSAYALTAAQRAAVRETRTAPVTVIAGAPGTGKTHTIAAIVGDAVAQGRSVLVAAKAEPAVEAIVALLRQRPGPQPVVFGGLEQRRELSRAIARGEPVPVPAHEIARRWAALVEVLAHRDRLWTDAVRRMEGLALLADGPRARSLRRQVPGLTDVAVDLDEVEELLSEVDLQQQPGWWQLGARRRRARLLALLALPDVAGSSASMLPDAATLWQAVRLARAVRESDRLVRDRTPSAAARSDAGPDGGVDWQELAAAQRDVEEMTGRWIDAATRSERRLDRHVRGSLAALGTALRAGRAQRRQRLAELTGERVTHGLPVWLGTLGDIDDLLPQVPAMFDLVILDEASAIDQPRATPALLRGARAVIVGDPQQLRHVSFVADETVAAALQRHLPGADVALRARLDVRRSSTFDVAASGFVVRTLDEHFRCAPHLFDFVAHRLYDDAVHVATRTPISETADRIEIVRTDGDRDDARVVWAECEHVLQRLRAHLADGADHTIGVVSPFRAQADAIESAVLEGFSTAQIRRMGLRVGTVHAFQGMQRDEMLLSLGVGRSDGATTWRFVNDPHLFAVMVTRARRRLRLVLSAEPPAGTLLAEYLAQADQPPEQRWLPGPVDAFARELAADVAAAGAHVVPGYRAGRHVLDLCVMEGDDYLGVLTGLHPDGPHAHVARHLELLGAGWPLVAAPAGLWAHRRAELALEIVEALRG